MRTLAKQMQVTSDLLLQFCGSPRPEFKTPPVIGPAGRKLNVMFSKIVDVVAAGLDQNRKELMSVRRYGKAPWARHVCFWIINQLTDATQCQVGEFFDRDHTAISWGIIKVKEQREVDPKVFTQTEDLLRKCMGVFAVNNHDEGSGMIKVSSRRLLLK